MGEDHAPETHIIPNAIRAVLKEQEFTLFGTDYHTPDGTCIRDYIHVLDLIEAHVLALKKILNSEGGHIYNVGTGVGYSNREVLDMVRTISQKDIKIVEKPRRLGDSEILIADASKIQTDLAFIPKYSDLETIVRSAWAWHSRLKNEK